MMPNRSSGISRCEKESGTAQKFRLAGGWWQKLVFKSITESDRRDNFRKLTHEMSARFLQKRKSKMINFQQLFLSVIKKMLLKFNLPFVGTWHTGKKLFVRFFGFTSS